MPNSSREESDNDTSSVPESSRSWMSNLSFGSAVSSEQQQQKPHRANEAAWEAVRRLRRAAGRVGLEHFRLLKRVGSGDIGNVYVCQIRGAPRSLYAMKVVDREALAARKKLQRAEMEKDILGMLDHPFLPTLYADFEASHYSCLLMDYCPGGDLYAARQRHPAKRFPISSAKFYAAETVVALEYLHMMGIVYRDLKPENVLVRDDGHIMLSDFDLSFKCDVVPKIIRSEELDHDHDDQQLCAMPMQLQPSCFSTRARGRRTTGGQDVVAEPINGRSKSFVGTHEYLAPEVISGQGHGGAVDWWTLGVFLYEMLYGVTPFKGENNEKTLGNILKKPLTFSRVAIPTPKEVDEMGLAEDLMTKLLVKNPKKRIGSVKGSAEIKRHPFFRGLNWALIRSIRPPEDPLILRTRSRQERDAPFQIPSAAHNHFDYF